MKFEIVCSPYNSLPVVVRVDLDSAKQMEDSVNEVEGYQVPLFVIDYERQKVFRVVLDGERYFVSDDAYDLIGQETPVGGFKRMTGEN